MYQLVILVNKLSLLMLYFFVLEASGKDFGVNGNTYKISEEAFVKMIESRAKKMDVERIKEKMQKTAKERVENPLPVKNITPAINTRSFHHDPTYVLDNDTFLPCGKLLYKAGTSVNPLSNMDLERRIIFIDARRSKEVVWLKQKLKKLNGGLEVVSATIQDAVNSIDEDTSKPKILNKIVLVGGSPLKLQKDLDIEIYFDQQGALTTKWGIKHTPSIIEQDRELLKITEYALDRDNF